ncbi:hypothetical protein FVR03_01470 [Pontibacter qinzhouensis]|uniref:Uncharacterized protein n=1 Tax=Pontibacter qinzhouensis TaxID=2603253 RepID=A0A5C8KB43_9BACT|nr:hypothetical protein [Pontibacter qinzhouensis]TXK52414.1 hypothetical protein FVR03_01470 [Pontibacter qinzhouensis]
MSTPVLTPPAAIKPITPKNDPLLFSSKLDITIYNRYINKEMLSRFVSTSGGRIPAEVAADITQKFYKNQKTSQLQRKLLEADFYVHDIQLYETTNSWKIYFIVMGTKFETTHTLVGCYNDALSHYLLKATTSKDCATFVFSSPKVAGQGLQFSVYEHNTCSRKEQIFDNQITIQPDTMLLQRLPLSPAHTQPQPLL